MGPLAGFETEEERKRREAGQAPAPLVAPVQLAGPSQSQQPGVPQAQQGILDKMFTDKGTSTASDLLFSGGKATPSVASIGAAEGIGATMSAAAPWLALGYLGAKKLKLFNEGTDNVQGGHEMNKFNPSNPLGYAQGGMVNPPLAQQQGVSAPKKGEMVRFPNVRPTAKQKAIIEMSKRQPQGGPLGFAWGTEQVYVGETEAGPIYETRQVEIPDFQSPAGGFPSDIAQALIDQGGGTILKDGVWYQADVTQQTEQDQGGQLLGFSTYKDSENKPGGTIQLYEADGSKGNQVIQQEVPGFWQGLGEAVAVAAPIFLPFVAPALAGTIGASLGLSGTAAAAAGGAVISGASTAVAGGDINDILKSAAFGGVSAGVTDFIKGTETFQSLMNGTPTGGAVTGAGNEFNTYGSGSEFDTFNMGQSTDAIGQQINDNFNNLIQQGYSPELANTMANQQALSALQNGHSLEDAVDFTESQNQLNQYNQTVQDMIDRGYDPADAREIAASQVADADITQNLAESQKALDAHNALQEVAQKYNWTENLKAQGYNADGTKITEQTNLEKVTEMAKSLGTTVTELVKANPVLTAVIAAPVVKKVVDTFNPKTNVLPDTKTTVIPWVPGKTIGTGPLTGVGPGGNAAITRAPTTAINAQLGNSLGTNNGTWYNPLGLNLRGMQAQTVAPQPTNVVAPVKQAPLSAPTVQPAVQPVVSQPQAPVVQVQQPVAAPLMVQPEAPVVQPTWLPAPAPAPVAVEATPVVQVQQPVQQEGYAYASAPSAEVNPNTAPTAGVVVANTGGYIEGFARGGFMNPSARNPKQFPLMPNNPAYVNGPTGSTQVRQGGNPRYQKQGFAAGTTGTWFGPQQTQPQQKGGVGSRGGLPFALGIPNPTTRAKKKGGE